jgi:hypothetical protein
MSQTKMIPVYEFRICGKGYPPYPGLLIIGTSMHVYDHCGHVHIEGLDGTEQLVSSGTFSYITSTPMEESDGSEQKDDS